MSIARSILSASNVGGWDIANIAKTGVSFDASSVAPFDNNLNGVFFKPDGTLIVCVGSGDNQVFSLSLSTPWDISTAAAGPLGPDFSFNPCHDVFLDPSGTNLYVLFRASSIGYVEQYSLSVPWDVSSYSFVARTFADNVCTGFFFSPDGLQYFVVDEDDTLRANTMSVAWTISTATAGNSYNFSLNTVPTDVFFRKDGRKMYVTQKQNMQEYNLLTPWDITSLSFVQTKSLLLSSPQAAFFRPDGKRCFVGENQNGFIYEYSL
jgi:DNA-binding beta-propeller fold protein YncE